MSLEGYCNESTCLEGLTRLYECQCCSQFVCSQHRSVHFMADMTKKADKMVLDFISVSNECIPKIVRKNQEGQREQQLIDQSIPLNREGEIIINVDLPTSSDIVTSPEDVLPPPPEDILTIIKSPIKRKTPHDINELRTSKRLKANARSTKTNNSRFDDQEQNNEELMASNNIINKCPLTFDGAFGLTIAKHSIKLCTANKTYVNLLSHFQDKHQMKKCHATRLYKSTKNGDDATKTNLFNEVSTIIDHDHFIVCPLATDISDSIEGFPNEVNNMPCENRSINRKIIKRHLTTHHGLSLAMATKILESTKKSQVKI
ncbi:unnamed protein product [Adineta steineri]|uniref:Uncharacterized protein n=1 Tax=Adineta steineri TaxID=433720 RepID=A0A819UHB8_9BILA|nr:unnamed protein product [Adineta steineri]CAF4080176.1 unnamed protein product [Adineta steineri]